MKLRPPAQRPARFQLEPTTMLNIIMVFVR